MSDVRDNDDDDYAALDKLTSRIDQLASMCRPKDRDDEAKVRFLTGAVNGTAWGLSALQRLPAEPSYQRLVNALYTSMRELGTFEENQTTGAVDNHKRFRKSLWRRGAKDTQSPEAETFLAELVDTFYTGQKQWGRDPKNIHRGRREAQTMKQRTGNQSDIKRKGPCFNCEMYGCSLRSCKKPTDANTIRRNLNRWKQKRGLVAANGIFCIDECVENSSTDDEAVEILMSINIVNQELNKNNEAEEDEGILHNRLATRSQQHVDVEDEGYDVLVITEQKDNQGENTSAIQRQNTYASPFQNIIQRKCKTAQFTRIQKIETASSAKIKRNNLWDHVKEKQDPPPNIHLNSTTAQKEREGNTAQKEREGKFVKAGKYTREKFFGAFIDTGASKSVCGHEQALAYRKHSPSVLRLNNSTASFRFGNHVISSEGTLNFRISIIERIFITIKADIIKADIPLLITLQDLKRHQLLLDYLNNVLFHKASGTKLPTTTHDGHIFLQSNHTDTYFTRAELLRLHLHFLHPSTDKLFQLIKRARPNDTDKTIWTTLQEILRACEHCMEFAQSPIGFRASLPSEELLFNHEVAIDLMWLEESRILHVMDTHTGFQSASTFRGKRPQMYGAYLWNAGPSSMLAILTSYV